MNKVNLHTAYVFVKEMVDDFGRSNYFVSKQVLCNCIIDKRNASVGMDSMPTDAFYI